VVDGVGLAADWLEELVVLGVGVGVGVAVKMADLAPEAEDVVEDGVSKTAAELLAI